MFNRQAAAKEGMSALVKVKVPPLHDGDDLRIEEMHRTEVVEAGDIVSVQYGDLTDILTEHGLKLLVSGRDLDGAPLGMEGALALLEDSVDRRGWPLVLETPVDLYDVTDCSGLVFRPSYWYYDVCMRWVENEASNLIRHFGVGARFGFTPEFHEVREVNVGN